MNKKMILSNTIFGIMWGFIYYFVISNSIIETIVSTLGVLILCTILEVVFKKRREKKASMMAISVDRVKVDKFIDAIGGQVNVTSVSHEVSRVKVFLEDVDLIDQDKLKALELDGAFLSGNQLQVTFGKQANRVAQHIKEQIK